MHIRISRIVEVDLVAERKRIRRCFSGDRRKRLLNLVAEFEEGNWNECWRRLEAMQDMPYDKKDECSELEYVNTEIFDILKHGKTWGERLEVWA